MSTFYLKNALNPSYSKENDNSNQDSEMADPTEVRSQNQVL